MSKFCGKCGSPVDPATGVCTSCGFVNTVKKEPTPVKPGTGATGAPISPKPTPAPKVQKPKKSKEEKKKAWSDAKARYKEDTKKKKAAMSGKQKAGRIAVKIILILVILGLLGTGIFFGLKALGVFSGKGKNNNKTEKPNTEETSTEPTTEELPSGSVDIYSPPTGTMPDEYNVTSPNADEFFSNNSEIIAQSNAASGGSTEAEAYAELSSRGFTSFSITTSYKSDGTLIEEKEISKTGTDKHPTYQTYYQTADGEFWTIFEINGHVMANPVSYNMSNGSDIQVIISETGTIMSYDSTLNKFYETKPQETALTVKVVDKIDAATLEAVDIDALLDIMELATETEVALTDVAEEVV